MGIVIGFNIALANMRRSVLLLVFLSATPLFFSAVLYTAGWAASGGRADAEKWAYQLVGLALVALSQTALGSTVWNLRELMARGIYEYIVASPMSVPLFMAGYWLGVATPVMAGISASTSLALFAAMGPTYGLAMLAALAISVVGLAPLFGIGLVAASLVPYVRDAQSVANPINALVALIGGLIYPIYLLPHYLQYVAAAFPAWPWGEVVRGLALSLEVRIGGLVLLGVHWAYLAIGVLAFMAMSLGLRRSGHYNVW